MSSSAFRTSLALAVLAACVVCGPLRAGDALEVRERAFRLLNEGVSAYGRGEYDLAEDKLRQAGEIALNNFRAYLYHGLALSKLRRHREALSSLEISLDLEPTNLQALVALGDAYLSLGDVPESRAGYYRALKERPEYPAALDGLARAYEAEADFPKAVEMYRRAIASDPGYADAYMHLGELYLRQERYQEAVDLLSEAVEVRPDFGAGLNRLSLAYGRLGLYNEAVATIERAIALEPNEPAHPAALGLIQVGLGLLNRAEESFGEALARDPAQPLALRGLAEIERRRGDYDAALADLDRALADDRLRAWMRERLEAIRAGVETERADMILLESRVETGEAAPEELRALAKIYAGRGLYSRAADLLRRTEPEGDDLGRVGYLLLRADRYREAIAIYDRLLASAPAREDWRFNRGVALAGLGLDTEAAATFETVARAGGDLAVRAGLFRANALLRLGRTAEAADGYAAYLAAASEGEEAERVRRILEQIAPDRIPAETGAPGRPARSARSTVEENGS